MSQSIFSLSSSHISARIAVQNLVSLRWHGTRTNVVASGGLRTSPLAHGTIGTRLAVPWNQNCLDEFPTAVLQLWIDNHCINCSQAFRAGHISRGCAELSNIIIEAILLRHRLLDALRQCFNLTSWRLGSRGVSGCLSSVWRAS